MTAAGPGPTDTTRGIAPILLARSWFAVQAIAGVTWWVAVFSSGDVRYWTLGTWDPVLLVIPDLVLFVGAAAIAAASANRIAATVAAVWTTAVTVALVVYGLARQVAGWGVVAMSIATLGAVAACATVWTGRLPTEWFFVGPFSFRVAPTASAASHVRRSLAQLVVFWSVFFLVVPLALVFVEQRLKLSWGPLGHTSVLLAGALVFALGSATGLASCLAMALRGHGTPLPAETARHLVVAGPYRFVRNPMAVAGVTQTAGVGLMLGSWMVVAIALAGAVAWNVLIRPAEEADLLARFGESYHSYRERVRCWIPTAPRIAVENSRSRGPSRASSAPLAERPAHPDVPLWAAWPSRSSDHQLDDETGYSVLCRKSARARFTVSVCPSAR